MKVKAVDVMASIKVGTALVLYPIYCIGSTIAFYIACRKYTDWEFLTIIQWNISFFILFPLISLISIRSSDGVVSHFYTL